MRRILLVVACVLCIISAKQLWAGDNTTVHDKISILSTSSLSTSDNAFATGLNNSPKLVYDASRNLLHAVFSNEDCVWYKNSNDGGLTWFNDANLGEGIYPGLTKDSNNELHCAWVCLTPSYTFSEPTDTAPQPMIVPYVQYLWELKYRHTQNGEWQGNTVKVIDSFEKTPEISDNIHYSSPAIVTTDDSVHILMEQTSYSTMSGGGWFWQLCYYSFQKGQSDVINYTVIDGAFQIAPAPPPFMPESLVFISDPSCVVDKYGNLHIVYAIESEVRYVKKIGDSLSEIQVISPGGEYQQPSISINVDEITVVFSGCSQPGEPSQILSRRKFLNGNWGQIERIDTGDNLSVYPVSIQNQVLWSEQVEVDNYEIFYSRLSGYEWVEPVNLSNTSDNSMFAYVTPVEQDVHYLYTDGSEPPFTIITGSMTVLEQVPLYAVNLGSEELASGTVQRDGFIDYGSESYQAVDYDTTQLIYVLTGFDPARQYDFVLDWYHESNEDWKQLLRIDDIFTAQKWVPSYERTTIRKSIPPACLKDGEIEITNTLTSDNGLAILSGFVIYDITDDGGTQSKGEKIDVNGLSLNVQNPVVINAKMTYTLPCLSNASIRIYDVTGSLVKMINLPRNVMKGTIFWDTKDNKDQLMASGIYFCQLKSNEGDLSQKIILIK